MTEEITLNELCTHISYHDDDYDNEDSIVCDVEVEPVTTLSNIVPYLAYRPVCKKVLAKFLT